MKKRIIAAIALLALLSLALVACAGESYSFVDKSYIYESLVNDGSFTIDINKDGTYKYSVPTYNVIITGSWEYDGDILTLTETTELVDVEIEGVEEGTEAYYRYLFRVDGENLVYVAEGSSGFPFADIADGALFINIGNINS